MSSSFISYVVPKGAHFRSYQEGHTRKQWAYHHCDRYNVATHIQVSPNPSTPFAWSDHKPCSASTLTCWNRTNFSHRTNNKPHPKVSNVAFVPKTCSLRIPSSNESSCSRCNVAWGMYVHSSRVSRPMLTVVGCTCFSPNCVRVGTRPSTTFCYHKTCRSSERSRISPQGVFCFPYPGVKTSGTGSIWFGSVFEFGSWVGFGFGSGLASWLGWCFVYVVYGVLHVHGALYDGNGGGLHVDRGGRHGGGHCCWVVVVL